MQDYYKIITIKIKKNHLVNEKKFNYNINIKKKMNKTNLNF